MSAVHHEFADSESAAFLYGEGDGKHEETPLTSKRGLWTRISRYVPYVLLALGILLALLIVVSSPKDKDDGAVTDIQPSQAMFGKSMFGPHGCSVQPHVFTLLTKQFLPKRSSSSRTQASTSIHLDPTRSTVHGTI